MGGGTHSEAIAQGGALGGAAMADRRCETAGEVGRGAAALFDAGDGALGAETLVQALREPSGSSHCGYVCVVGIDGLERDEGVGWFRGCIASGKDDVGRCFRQV